MKNVLEILIQTHKGNQTQPFDNTRSSVTIQHSHSPTPEQTKAINNIADWFHDSNQKTYSLGGTAGTGKSFIIPFLIKKLNLNNYQCQCAAYTGKATVVMKNYGVRNPITIHHLLYESIKHKVNRKDYNGQGIIIKKNPSTVEYITFEKKKSLDYGLELVIIDEASMINKSIHQDLISFPNIKILYIGDYFQLPPVSSDNFSIMSEKSLSHKLVTIHRQAWENPIIKLADNLRNNSVNPEKYINKYPNVTVMPQEKMTEQNLVEKHQILTGKNLTRTTLNHVVRTILGFNTPLPLPSEKIIVLKNNHNLDLMNGQILVVQKITPLKNKTQIEFLTQFQINNNVQLVQTNNPVITIDVDYYYKQFNHFKYNHPFPKPTMRKHNKIYTDFAYAITVHKAQGSSFGNVCVYDDNLKNKSIPLFKNKWLYTAVTRAEEKVMWLYV